MGELKSRAHSFGQNCFHLIWSPKLRLPLLKVGEIRQVCDGVLRMIAFKYGMVVHELRVLPDHVHLFVEVPPSMSVSLSFQYLKGVSSRVLRRRFPWLRKFPCLWSRGKFYRSVGSVTSDVVEHYIRHSQGTWSYFDVKRNYFVPDQIKLSSY